MATRQKKTPKENPYQERPVARLMEIGIRCGGNLYYNTIKIFGGGTEQHFEIADRDDLDSKLPVVLSLFQGKVVVCGILFKKPQIFIVSGLSSGCTGESNCLSDTTVLCRLLS